MGAIAHLHHARSAWTDQVRPGWWPQNREDRNRLWVAFLAAYRGQGLSDRDKLTQATKNVFHALLFEFLNLKRGDCFPSYETIAAKARISRRAVASAVKQLQAYGFLFWQRRRRVIRLGQYAVEVQTSNAYSFAKAWLSRGAECKKSPETHSNIFNNNNSGLPLWITRLKTVATEYDRETRRQKDLFLSKLGIGAA